MSKIPNGFTPTLNNEHFTGTTGPWYVNTTSQDDTKKPRVLGILIEKKHTNMIGVVHGGLLVTMADTAMGYSLSRATTPPQKIVTVSLSSDFLSSAVLGDWIEAHVTILKIGKRMSYADCQLKCNSKIIFRSSGVFAKI
jgi:uncharacterized protein (TIGR00369 family)